MVCIFLLEAAGKKGAVISLWEPRTKIMVYRAGSPVHSSARAGAWRDPTARKPRGSGARNRTIKGSLGSLPDTIGSFGGHEAAIGPGRWNQGAKHRGMVWAARPENLTALCRLDWHWLFSILIFIFLMILTTHLAYLSNKPPNVIFFSYKFLCLRYP